MEYNIFEPWKTLDKWQEDYIAAEGNCFVLCGRQSGKTAAASIKFGKRAANNPKQIILMLAYTEKQAYNLFFKTLMYLEKFYSQSIKRGNDKPTKHIINLKNGSQIMCYAAGLTGEGIRTFTITSLVIDEAAPMAKEVFIATMPMLSVTNGTLDIISTPRGKEGFFYECSKRDDFTKFYISAENCPRHTKKFLEAQKSMMGTLYYAQEYLAKFLDEIRRVFTDRWIQNVCKGKRRKEILKGRIYDIGCDVARKDKDEFTYEIFDRTDKNNIVQVENIITRNVPIPESTRRIIELNKLYNFKKEFIDSGGMGITVCDILREDEQNKRKVVEINNASRRYQEDGEEKKKGILKEDLYENLVALGDSGKLTLLNEEDLIISLQSVQFEIINGKAKYFGNNTHIAEGAIRGVWGEKDKSLNPCIF